jgi:hypothetical protein
MENKSSNSPNYDSVQALKNAGVVVKPIAEKVLNKLDWGIWKADIARNTIENKPSILQRLRNLVYK